MGLTLKMKGVRVSTLTNLTTVDNAAVEHSQTHDMLICSHHMRKMEDMFSKTLDNIVMNSRVPVLVVHPNDKVQV